METLGKFADPGQKGELYKFVRILDDGVKILEDLSCLLPISG